MRYTVLFIAFPAALALAGCSKHATAPVNGGPGGIPLYALVSVNGSGLPIRTGVGSGYYLDVLSGTLNLNAGDSTFVRTLVVFQMESGSGCATFAASPATLTLTDTGTFTSSGGILKLALLSGDTLVGSSTAIEDTIDFRTDFSGRLSGCEVNLTFPEFHQAALRYQP